MAFNTPPASSPPSTTRLQLILPMCDLRWREERLRGPRGQSRGSAGRGQAHYGASSTPTSPPSPSRTEATPFGTTQSQPSTRRLKWYRPDSSRKAPSHSSPASGLSGTGYQAFQSPAIATAFAPSKLKWTTTLSPRRSGTRGGQRRVGASTEGRRLAHTRTLAVT